MKSYVGTIKLGIAVILLTAGVTVSVLTVKSEIDYGKIQQRHAEKVQQAADKVRSANRLPNR